MNVRVERKTPNISNCLEADVLGGRLDSRLFFQI